MRKIKNIYLGVSPGTRYIGFAVMRNNDLTDWFVKTFPGTWSSDKLRKMKMLLTRIITSFAISEIAVKVPEDIRRSKALDKVINLIEQIAESRKVTVDVYTIQEIKKRLKCKNKGELIERMVIKYPELQTEFNLDSNKYHAKIFEACGVISIL